VAMLQSEASTARARIGRTRGDNDDQSRPALTDVLQPINPRNRDIRDQPIGPSPESICIACSAFEAGRPCIPCPARGSFRGSPRNRSRLRVCYCERRSRSGSVIGPSQFLVQLFHGAMPTTSTSVSRAAPSSSSAAF